MAWTLVQSVKGAAGAGTVTIPSVGAGHLLVAVLNPNPGTIPSLTDGTNTWRHCTNAFDTAGTGTGDSDIWYAYNSAAGSFTISGTTGSTTINVFEYSHSAGSITADPFEVATTGTATGSTSVTSGSFSPAAAGNLNVAFAASSVGHGTGAGSGYTLQMTDNGDNEVEDNQNAAAGSQTASMSGASQNWVISVASFKAPGSAVANSNFLMFMGPQPQQ